MFAGYALELLEQVEPVAKDPRALLDAVSVYPFPHAAYPAACARLAEILGLLGLLAGGPAADAGLPGLPAARISGTVADLLEHQPGCHHPISDGFAVSTDRPGAPDRRARRRSGPGLPQPHRGLDPGPLRPAVRRSRARGHLRRPRGGSGLAARLGLRERPPQAPWSYVATVLADLAAVIPGGRGPVRGRGQRLPGRGRLAGAPAGRRAASAVAARRAGRDADRRSRLREPLPPDGVAAQHFTDQEPPVPAWDALALASVARNRHVVRTLRATCRIPPGDDRPVVRLRRPTWPGTRPSGDWRTSCRRGGFVRIRAFDV